MDADMLVFKDMKEVFDLPFKGAKVIVQDDLTHTDQETAKLGAPRKRKKQCAVMKLNCERLLGPNSNHSRPGRRIRLCGAHG